MKDAEALKAIDVATRAMQNALETSGGDDVRLTKALAESMQDPEVARAFRTVGYLTSMSEINTKH